MYYPDVFVALLVGGRARRLGGVDKARLVAGPDQRTTLQNLVERLRPAVGQLYLVGRSDQKYSESFGELVFDRRPGQGPLGGLEAALRMDAAPWCWLVGCDLPHLDLALLRLLAAARKPGVSVVVPFMQKDTWEPIGALYHRSLLPEIESRLADGKRALRDLISAVPKEEVLVPEGMKPMLVNVNTEEEMLRAGLRFPS